MIRSAFEGSCLDPEASDRLVRGDVSRSVRRELERHIAACPPCRELVSALVKLERAGTRNTALTKPLPARVAGAAVNDLRSGALLGRYILLERLGEGGMGVVYSAHDSELNRRVALKLLRADLSPAEQGRLRERIRREARAMAQMAHPNVVTVYDVGTWEDRTFIAMEMVEGETLLQWLARKARSWREVVAMFSSAGQGLAAAHAAGLVHRDFKPANVLIGRDGRARVGDFGLAALAATAGPPTGRRACDDLAPSTASRCTPGSVAGTPYYMAPEQLRGDAADARSDQFSFCVALYEAISGVHPFAGESIDASLAANTGLRLRSRPARSIPRWLHRVLMRGLSMEPGQRHPSMSTLLRSLTRDAARRWVALRASALVAALFLASLLALPRLERGIPREPARDRAGAGWRYDAAVFAGAPDVLAAYEREWVATHTDACETPQARCAIQTTNLLRGAGFDRPGHGWRAADGQAVQLTWRAGLLNATTTRANRSVVQDVPWIIPPGRSYRLGVHVRVPDGHSPLRGRLRLWGIGRGRAVSSTTPFLARAHWSPVAVTFSPKGHYYRFRAELELESAGSIELDDAELIDAGLVDASFEDASIVHRSAAWRPYNLASHVQTRWLVTDAFDGVRALEVRTTRKDGSVAQDTFQSPLVGTTYTFIARLRAGRGASKVAGNLVLWGLGEQHRLAITGFEVGRSWTDVAVSLDVEEHGYRSLRAEVYVGTPNAPLEIDATRLAPAGLVNASFEAGSSGWYSPDGAVDIRRMEDPAPRGRTGLFEPGRAAAGARDGASWLRLSGKQSSASVAQELGSPLAGTTYTFSAWVRSARGSRPVSGALEVQASGATRERARADFQVTGEWTLVVATLDLERDHERLRVEVSVTDAGSELDIDGARLTGANVIAPLLRDGHASIPQSSLELGK
jgi:hypothetical protein